MTSRNCPAGLAIAVTLVGTGALNVLLPVSPSLSERAPGLAVVLGLCAARIVDYFSSKGSTCTLTPRIYGSRLLFYVALTCMSLFVVIPGTLPDLPLFTRGLLATFVPAALAFGLDHWLVDHSHQQRPALAKALRGLKILLLAIVVLWYPVLVYYIWTSQ